MTLFGEQSSSRQLPLNAVQCREPGAEQGTCSLFRIGTISQVRAKSKAMEVAMERLDGRGVAITGGAGDIGAAMGAELRRLGATVTLIDRKSPSEAEP